MLQVAEDIGMAGLVEGYIQVFSASNLGILQTHLMQEKLWIQ
jgi:hypothetical protein